MAVGFGKGRDKEDHCHREQRHHEPEVLLGAHDVRQVKGTRHQQYGDDDEAHGDLVRHHLRCRTQRAEEGIARIGRPAGHQDAIDPQRRDGEQVKDADVDVGQHQAIAEGDHGPGDQRHNKGHAGRGDENNAVGTGWYDRFLDEQLQPVGDRLQQPEWADDVGPATKVHGTDDLALDIGQIGHRQKHRRDDDDDLDDDPGRRPDVSVPQLGPKLQPRISHRFRSFSLYRRPTVRCMRPWSPRPG